MDSTWLSALMTTLLTYIMLPSTIGEYLIVKAAPVSSLILTGLLTDATYRPTLVQLNDCSTGCQVIVLLEYFNYVKVTVYVEKLLSCLLYLVLCIMSLST